MAPVPRNSVRSRLREVSALLVAVGLLAACSEADAVSGEETLDWDEPIPEEVPEGTVLRIGDPSTQRALEVSGLIDEIPFEIEWANFSGGPQVSEAFRAEALDAGAVAEIPALHAYWTDLPTRTIVANHRDNPVYQIGIAPGASDEVDSLEDLEGKRIAYSPGQAQGALVLRILDDVGLTTEDVELIEIPSTADEYPNALSSDEVDAAPLGVSRAVRYIEQYGEDGAEALDHGLPDGRGGIYVDARSLENPDKAAALAVFAEYWGKAIAWRNAHPEIWAEEWYVEHQDLTPEQAELQVELDGKTEVPVNWDEILEQDQATADLLLDEQDRADPIDVEEDIFDLRFEHIAGEAFEEATAEYDNAD